MIRFLLIISTICLTVSVSSAQQFSAAVKAGVSTSQISGDNLSGYNKAGFMAGALVSLPMSEKFDLAMEIMYIEKGSRRQSDPENGDYEYYRLRLNYIEIPVMLRWNFSKRFTFEAGPAIGFLLKESEEDEYGIINRSPERPFNKTELGVGGGMHVHFARNFSFIARIESSVLAVREHESGETYRFNRGQYNAVLSFALQYNFRKKNNN